MTLIANFAQELTSTYTLIMVVDPASSGTVDDQTNDGPYVEGSQVSIKAAPAEGYQFVNWTAPAGSFGDANSLETTFTMPAQDVTVTANIELIPPATYTLTLVANPAEGGILSGGGEYQEGQGVAVSAEANTGWEFVSWTRDGTEVSTDASFTYTMPAGPVTLTANFELIENTKKDKLKQNNPGKGLEDAQGLEKEFNPNSKANENAGKKK